MQQAIYQKATNAKQILWYLKTPTKTKDAEYTPDDVKNSLVPNPDNWIWKEPTVLEARKEVWGY